MTTTTHNTEPTTAQLPAAVIPPTPTEIDTAIAKYETARKLAKIAADDMDEAKKSLINLVDLFGYAPAHAEQSRRINGALHTATVTVGTTVIVNEQKVDDLFSLLHANLDADRADAIFGSLFTERNKHELTAGAEKSLKTMPITNTRLTQKVQSAFGQCIIVKSKAPSVKVELLKKEKPARKPRAKKGGAQ